MTTRYSGLARRSAALLGTTALAFGSALITVPAHAAPMDDRTDTTGKATATAARVDINVSVLDGINVPVTASLSKVSAPADAREALLTAEVKGAHNGTPVTLVDAEVAHSSAKANTERSVGDVKLVGVRAYAPGLPSQPLLSADLLTANATCEADAEPTAAADLEEVKILGKPVDVKELQAGDTKNIEVPAVGTVDLSLEEVTTTDSTAAATALRLTYTVNPANLNVVKATGEIVLAEATCAAPTGSDDGGSDEGSENGGSDGGSENGGATDGQTAGSTSGSSGGDSGSTGNDPDTQTGGDGTNLAETGGSSSTAVIGGLGAAVLLLGGGALYTVRRRKAAQGS